MAVYLEISPRNTGKTSRLVAAATTMLRMEILDYAVLRCHTHNTYERIRERFSEDLRPRVVSLTKELSFRNRAGYFFDEFDFYGEDIRYFTDEVRGSCGYSYYCTTPSFIRRYAVREVPCGKEVRLRICTEVPGKTKVLDIKEDPMYSLLCKTRGKYDTVHALTGKKSVEEQAKKLGLSAPRIATELRGEFGFDSMARFLNRPV